MTLDEVAKLFRLSPSHDYGSADYRDGRIVGLRGLGIWASDLKKLRDLVPDLRLIEINRVKHLEGDWLRVDVWED